MNTEGFRMGNNDRDIFFGFTVCVVSLLVILIGSGARADNEGSVSLYPGFFVGSDFNGMSRDVSWSVGGVISIRDGRWKVDAVDLVFQDSAFQIMWNLWYEPMKCEALCPFIGGGLGLGQPPSSLGLTGVGFAWNIGTGLSWKVGRRVSIIPRYRAVGQLVDSSGGGDGLLVNNEFTIGFEFVFSNLPETTRE